MNFFKILNFSIIFFLISGVTYLFFFKKENKTNGSEEEEEQELFTESNEETNLNLELNKEKFYIIKNNKKIYFKHDEEFNFEYTEKPDVKNGEPLGIYVDFIYNPNFNTELKVVQYILLEILNKTKINYYYDYENHPSSTVITTGFEEGYVLNKKNFITIKPKLLKDVLYNQDIFFRIYILIYYYFRIGVKYEVIPEYDRTINYKKYKNIFKEELKKLDRVNFNNIICRNELKYKYKNRFCIKVANQYIEESFINKDVSQYYRIVFYRIGWFVSKIIEANTNLIEETSMRDCYEIYIYPEVNINRVLLLPHAAVMTASRDQKIEDINIISMIITIKHRILHSLGLIHKYTLPSVMSNYENVFQKNNLFFIMMEDYEALNQCYGNYNKITRYVKNSQEFNETLYSYFLTNFSEFKKVYMELY